MRGNQGGGRGPHGAGHGQGLMTWTEIAAGTSTYAGSSTQDWVYLGGAGSTIAISAVERLMGGAGTDVVTLGDAGSTISVAAIETLTGGTGTDVVLLGQGGNTLSLSGIETLVGSGGTEALTITAGTVRYESGGGATSLTLAAANGTDQVVLTDCAGGFPFANTTSFNQIANFQTGTDQLVLGGRLRSAVDDDADGVVDSATATTGAVDLSAAEIVALSTTVTSLTDTDFTSVRTAIGSLVNSSRGAEAVVLASDGSSTGAYLVTDANGDGAVAATEIKLLGVFTGTSVALTDVVFG